MNGRLRLQRYMGRPGRPAPTVGQWLVTGAGLQLRRSQRQRGWTVQACAWVYNDYADPLQLPRAEHWLRQTGLLRASFPTRRAAWEEVQRLHRARPLPLQTWGGDWD